jgi:flagellar operon protein
MTEPINLPLEGLRPIQPPASKPAAGAPRTADGKTFDEILKEKVEGVRFSAHALKRLQSRDIRLSEGEMARLEQGLQRAGAKGSQDSLILMDQLAFVVSVSNRMVVTAVDDPTSREAVFTQIDSALFV